MTNTGFYQMIPKNRMKISILKKIAGALNVSPRYFFNDKSGNILQSASDSIQQAGDNPKASYHKGHNFFNKEIAELRQENNNLRSEVPELKD